MLQLLAHREDIFPIEGLISTLLHHPVTPSLSLLLFVSLPLSPPPSLNYTYSEGFFSSQVSSAAVLKCPHRCRFETFARDGMTMKLHASMGDTSMMKRFVTIVLRGLVSLSKETPIWAKEHHRPPMKEIRRKRRAVNRAKTMGRRNLVRAVGIPPVVSQLDHWSFSVLHCHSLNTYSPHLVVSMYVTFRILIRCGLSVCILC